VTAITVGAPLANATGVYTLLPAVTPQALADLLNGLPADNERWWSGHLWRENKRSANRWLATSALVLDLDYEAPGDPFPEQRDALVELATSGRLPGSVFHLTPHGARVALLLDAPISVKHMSLAAAWAAEKLVARAILGSGYAVDSVCGKDLARLYFAPRAYAKGVQRDAKVIVMREQVYTLDEMADVVLPSDPKPDPPPPPRAAPRIALVRTFEAAAAAWTAAHPREYPTRPSTCPACGHNDCWHALPESPRAWFCFSSGHLDSVGQRRDNGYCGDALDLEAHERHCKPVDVLRSDGYLPGAGQRVTPPRGSQEQPVASLEPEPDVQTASHTLRSGSISSVIKIITENMREVLEGRRLVRDEMSGLIYLGKNPIRDSDVTGIRARIEDLFTGGCDKGGFSIGMKFTQSDVHAAVERVADIHPWHPVREYLTGLAWDGVERLDHVAEDILSADGTTLNRAMMRKFFISAVARALSPGCKVDTVPILVGKQGSFKSTFFETISSPWFDNTAINIDDKDAYQVMRGCWILEWAELESLLRARDQAAVKSFLSGQKDSYRPSYGRHPIVVLRSGIIVGSTNNEQFLNDETGSRRFWPIRVGQIQIDLAASQRDQLWAEAVHRYRAGEQWHMTPQESATLSSTHENHRVVDAWEDQILEWVEQQSIPPTTGDILAGALSKPIGMWNRADEMRVSFIMKSAGYVRKTSGKRRFWYLPDLRSGVPNGGLG